MAVPIVAGTTLSDLSRNSLALQQIDEARRQGLSDRLYRDQAFGQLSAAQQQQGQIDRERIQAGERVGTAPYQANPVEMARIQAGERLGREGFATQREIARNPFMYTNPTEIARIAGSIDIAGLDAETRQFIARIQHRGVVDTNDAARFSALLNAQEAKRATKAQLEAERGRTNAVREQTFLNYSANIRNTPPWETQAALTLAPTIFGGGLANAEPRNLENDRRRAAAVAATKSANDLFKQYRTYGRGVEKTWPNWVTGRIPLGIGPYAAPFISGMTGGFLGGMPMTDAQARAAAAEDALQGFDPNIMKYDPNSLGFLPIPLQNTNPLGAGLTRRIMMNAFPGWGFDEEGQPTGQTEQPGAGGIGEQPGPTGGNNAPVQPWRADPRTGHLAP